jgi:signal peptidase I
MAKFLRLIAWALLIIFGLVGVLRATAIRWWQVPVGDPYLDASIEPTLHGGDWVILWRVTAPGAGDLALCPEPKTSRPVIGRIVGLQGQHIKVIKEALFIDQKPMDSESQCDKFTAHDPGSGLDVQQGCSNEVVAEKTHMTGMVKDGLAKPADAELDVPAGQVFLASDNRQFPWDSRDFGTVERSSCSETVVFRLVSKDGFFDVPNRLSLIH